MADVKDGIVKAALAISGLILKTAFYICVLVALYWCGREAYSFGHSVFDQQAMSPGEGQEITVVIQDTSALSVGKTLESKGLIENAYVFYVQEWLSAYHGKLQPGTYVLSTAYTPNRIMEILSGEADTSEST